MGVSLIEDEDEIEDERSRKDRGGCATDSPKTSKYDQSLISKKLPVREIAGVLLRNPKEDQTGTPN